MSDSGERHWQMTCTHSLKQHTCLIAVKQEKKTTQKTGRQTDRETDSVADSAAGPESHHSLSAHTNTSTQMVTHHIAPKRTAPQERGRKCADVLRRVVWGSVAQDINARHWIVGYLYEAGWPVMWLCPLCAFVCVFVCMHVCFKAWHTLLQRAKTLTLVIRVRWIQTM